jgi:hypothetical protein
MRAFLLASLLSSLGCIETILTNGEIASTRTAAASFDTLGDYELAKVSTQAGLAQFEGMHRIAPDNEDALFLLVQGWGGYAWGFVEDEVEEAQVKGDDAAADYHKKRAKMAYDRAVFYGLELLAHKDKGFEKAKKNDATLNAWLKEHFDSKDDAVNLFWVAYAWMSRVNLLQDDPAMVADLYIGVHRRRQEALRDARRRDHRRERSRSESALEQHDREAPRRAHEAPEEDRGLRIPVSFTRRSGASSAG